MQAGSKHLLVVVSESLPGADLLGAIERRKADGPVRCTVICPQNRPRRGMTFSDDTSAQAARNRLTVTLETLAELDIACSGEILDPDVYLATMDAVRSYDPDEIVIYVPENTHSGIFGRDLADRIRTDSGLPVEHVFSDRPDDQPGENTVAIVAGSFTGVELARALKERAAGKPGWLVVVCPTDGRDPSDVGTELRRAVEQLRGEGIKTVGQTMPCDTLIGIENAIQYYPAREIVVIGTSGEESRDIEQGVLKRLDRYTALPVERVAV